MYSHRNEDCVAGHFEADFEASDSPDGSLHYQIQGRLDRGKVGARLITADCTPSPPRECFQLRVGVRLHRASSDHLSRTTCLRSEKRDGILIESSRDAIVWRTKVVILSKKVSRLSVCKSGICGCHISNRVLIVSEQ